MVIELPVPYSIASAELFARGAVHILNSLGVVDILSFGSESGDIELLKKSAKIAGEIFDSAEFKKLIAKGISYPSAIQKVIDKNADSDVSNAFKTPNNTLAIEFV